MVGVMITATVLAGGFEKMQGINRTSVFAALSPLVSEAALSVLHDHCEAIEAMAHTKRDKLLANGLRILLENHEKRKAVLKSHQLVGSKS